MGKRSRHSQRMRNPQFYVSGKTPISPKQEIDLMITLIYAMRPLDVHALSSPGGSSYHPTPTTTTTTTNRPTRWRPNCSLTGPTFYSERPRGAGFRSVNPAERWRENPARALARAGFSQHLECGIHRSESCPEGSFALIPRPVARWAKTTP